MPACRVYDLSIQAFHPWFICTLLLRALSWATHTLFPLLKAIWRFRLPVSPQASYELFGRLFLLWNLLLSLPHPSSELFPMIPVLSHHKAPCTPSAYSHGTDWIEVDVQFLPLGGEFLQGKKRPRVHALESRPCTLSHSRCSINTRMKKSALKPERNMQCSTIKFFRTFFFY